jgi:hypothetical protein
VVVPLSAPNMVEVLSGDGRILLSSSARYAAVYLQMYPVISKP